MAFKDIWKPRVDGVDDADSSAVNEIAIEVIRLGNEVDKTSFIIDAEMSDDSENAVQNKVAKAYIDGVVGDIEGALDHMIALSDELIGGAV